MDSEDGSMAMITWVPITLLFMTGVWIFMGKVTDLLTNWQNHFAASNPNLPVSPDRVLYTGYMIAGFQALLLFAIVLPVIYYAVLVSRRRDNSNI